MKTLILVSLLIFGVNASAYCTVPAVYSQYSQSQYQQCVDNEQAQQRMLEQQEQILRNQRQMMQEQEEQAQQTSSSSGLKPLKGLGY